MDGRLASIGIRTVDRGAHEEYLTTRRSSVGGSRVASTI